MAQFNDTATTKNADHHSIDASEPNSPSQRITKKSLQPDNWFCSVCLPCYEIISPKMLILFLRTLSYGYGYQNSKADVDDNEEENDPWLSINNVIVSLDVIIYIISIFPKNLHVCLPCQFLEKVKSINFF